MKIDLSKAKSDYEIILLEKYGWPVIFVQRYLYGFRTVIPMSIGITRYSGIKFAIINLISAWAWAAITIVPAWYFGDEIWIVIHWIEKHWYFGVPLLIMVAASVVLTFKKIEANMLKKREVRKNENRIK